ncbi:MAG TPA: hypothetical protein PLE95_09055 [Bacteroidales bacterium]|nr:hypothetical protein [Bacteroidales bacterium]
MKTIRHLAAGLLFLTGVLHIYLSIAESTQEQFLPTLIFGIVYCILGFLIFLKKRFAIWIGLILPLLPLTGSLVKVDFKTTDPMTFIVLGFDLAILLSCLILILSKSKSQI